MSEKVGVSTKDQETKKDISLSQKQNTNFSQPEHSPFDVDQTLYWQRNLGNQAVQRLMEAGVIQGKFTIGQPNDKYEREANRVADQVMRMVEPGIQRQSTSPECIEEEGIQTKPLADQITPLVQRQVEPEEEEEEEIQAKLLTDQNTPFVQMQVEEEEEEEEFIQTKEEGGTSPEVTTNMESRIQSLKCGGQPLPETTLSFFEHRFGADFSRVRVHDGAEAAYAARSMNARAFTIGRDVMFGAGQYSPKTHTGKHLLAHELTHVVQQSGTRSNIQRACGRQAIGTPQGCTGSTPVFVPGALFRFNMGCDDFASGQDQALLLYATTLAPTDVIEIHGFSSVDGSVVFNRNLACARALRARELLATRGGIQRTRIIGIFNHGPTPGPAADRRSVVIRTTAHTGPTPLRFIVHSLNTTAGHLDDPEQTLQPGNVSWPLSFAVPSPISAVADVEVVGSPGDPCAQYQIGFLQTVYHQWLNIYYMGQQPTHGQTVVRYTVSLPIRDGDPNSMWYENSAPSRINPAACNVHVNPQMSDYPTIFSLPKVHQNTVRGHANYLDGVFRGITFLTTLAASGPGGVIPLRHFHWFYIMDIDFTPNYAAVNQVWPFLWNLNTAHPGPVQNGADNSIPIFTTVTPTYNQSLRPQIVEN